MAKNEYIAAIEIGSSKISGVVGMHTVSGIRILAYASEASNSYVSKGVIRNVDEASKSLNSLINRLESQMENIHIKKAYISFSSMSTHSIASKVVKSFDTFTKVTPEIIQEMLSENEPAFKVPAGYKKLQVVPQEYKLNGDTSTQPIGTPTMSIECNYLNIIVKEQYMRQLEESFATAEIEIAGSSNTARLEAEFILNEEEMNCGSALVNIGAETTTVAIYSGKMLRKLTVIPIGSANITKDICSEQISYNDAEQIKIFKGYNSAPDSSSPLTPEQINNIISGRMLEILKNVQYQIENSGYNIGRIIFTGGGTKLKNIHAIIEENLPNYKFRIANDIQTPYNNDNNLPITTGNITPTLFGLLSKGTINCCDEEVIAPADAIVPEDLFRTNTTHEEAAAQAMATTTERTAAIKESPDEEEAEEGATTETPVTKAPEETTGGTTEENVIDTPSDTGKGRNKKNPIEAIKSLFDDWWSGEVTSDESSRDERDNDEL